MPSYPLTPDHTIDDALPILTDIYQAASEASTADARPLVLAGDSAGGCLALVLAMQARDHSRHPADHLVLYAPGVDARLSSPGMEALQAHDPMLRCLGARDICRAWAGRHSLDDPLVSPIQDHLGDLPPMTVFQGSCDILLPDTVRFAAKAAAAGTPVDLRIEPAGFHVYPVAFWTPEGRRAINQTAAVIHRAAVHHAGTSYPWRTRSRPS